MRAIDSNRHAWRQFLLIHCAIIGAVLFLLFYDAFFAYRIFFLPFGCILHHWFLVYCPLCGGTRAIGSMLSLDFLTAFQQNAWVVLFALFAIVWDAFGVIRLIKGWEHPWSMPKWIYWVLIISLAIFFIVRNVMLIAFHIDPLGDLLHAWN